MLMYFYSGTKLSESFIFSQEPAKRWGFTIQNFSLYLLVRKTFPNIEPLLLCINDFSTFV